MPVIICFAIGLILGWVLKEIAGFNRINIRQYASDGLHPSTVLANTRIASIFAAEMKRLWQM